MRAIRPRCSGQTFRVERSCLAETSQTVYSRSAAVQCVLCCIMNVYQRSALLRANSSIQRIVSEGGSRSVILRWSGQVSCAHNFSAAVAQQRSNQPTRQMSASHTTELSTAAERVCEAGWLTNKLLLLPRIHTHSHISRSSSSSSSTPHNTTPHHASHTRPARARHNNSP